MGKINSETKPYYVIKDLYKTETDRANKENGRPKFFMQNEHYSTIFGYISGIRTESKLITPGSGSSKGIEIEIHNLIISITDEDGEADLQIPLYSGLSRTVLNALAGPDTLDNIYFSVYNNKHGFRAISVKHSTEKDDRVTPKYTWDETEAMIKMKKEKGKEVKDLDGLTDKFIEELIPIIQKKIGFLGNEEDDNKKPVKIAEKPIADDDDLPF